jgi:hypothetical protein
MQRKGASDMLWIIVGIVLALAVLTVWQSPLNWMRSAFGTVENAATCGASGTEGICKPSCDEGYVANDVFECDGAARCCVPQDVAEEEHQLRLKFYNFRDAMLKCYREEQPGQCDLAQELIYEAIPRSSEVKRAITIQRQGEDVIFSYYDGIPSEDNVEPLESFRYNDIIIEPCESPDPLFGNDGSSQAWIHFDHESDQNYKLVTGQETIVGFSDWDAGMVFGDIKLEGTGWFGGQKRVCIAQG